MMKINLKSNKGITLTALAITVIILVIISNMLIYSFKDNLKLENLKNMRNDISNLRDKVLSFYAQYGDIPANRNIEYTNIQELKNAGIISTATDTGKFYVIDLKALENVTLNYGRDYEKITDSSTAEQVNQLTDLYIINADSLSIFYVKGIELGGEKFYTDYVSEDVDKVPVSLVNPLGIYVTLYTDGTLGFNNTKETIPEKTVEKQYGDIKDKTFEMISNYEVATPWFKDRKKIKTVEIVNNIAPTNMGGWFFALTELTEIKDLTKVDTSNVTTMAGLFTFCAKLKSIDLSNFDTSKVTDMNSIFYNCVSLETIDISTFNTSNVTNMHCMFGAYTEGPMEDYDGEVSMKFDKIDGIEKLDTSNVTDMAYMFTECIDLEELDLRNFNTSKATDMRYMFANNKNLKSLNTSSFNTSNVINMEGMFSECPNLTTLDLRNFNTSKVENMYRLFSSDIGLTSVNIESFTTENLKKISGMFRNCKSLVSINMENFVGEKLTNLYEMFMGCESLQDLNIRNLSTRNVADVTRMFKDCKSLVNLDISGFDTSNVEIARQMFQNCSSLQNLILGDFETNNMKDMSYLFDKCSNLREINLTISSTVTDIRYILSGASMVQGTITIEGNPQTYLGAFSYTGTNSNVGLTVNYHGNICTNIQGIKDSATMANIRFVNLDA